MILPAIVLLCVVFRPQFDPVGWSLLLFVPSLILAFLLRFLLEWTVALVAFWTTRVTAMNQIYFSLHMFLSGRVAPIAMLPLWLSETARFLPFYYAIGFPVELALGRLTPREAAEGFTIQILWLVVTVAVISLTWRRAAARFSAVGS